MNKSHLFPEEIPDIVRHISAPKEEALLICRCRSSPDPNFSVRILIFNVRSAQLKQVYDCWIKTNDFTTLSSAIPNKSKLCSCDAMYATKPIYVWTRSSEELIIWKKNKIVARMDTNSITFRRGWFRKNKILFQDITSIHRTLSSGAETTGISIITNDSTSHRLCSKFEAAPIVGLSYDEFELMTDSYWSFELGKDISEFIGVPLTKDKELP